MDWRKSLQTLSVFGAIIFGQNAEAFEKCEYRRVVKTNGGRLLVNSKLEAGGTILDRLHPNDHMQVLATAEGRQVSDTLLGESSKTWHQIRYIVAGALKKGWVSSLYTECVTSCAYVEVYRTGTQTLAVKDSPAEGGKTVHRLHPSYIVAKVGEVTDGMEIKDAALGDESSTWHKIEYYDLVSSEPKTGWVNELYAFCSHGRMNSRDGKLRLPVPGRHLSSDEDDHLGRGSVNAWDINAPLGTPAKPIASGTVSYAGCNNAGGYGCWTYISHDNGMKTIMAHFIDGSLQVKTGQRVTQETVLGRVGWTGFTTFGPHSHLEMIVGGVKVPIERYFEEAHMKYCYLCNVKK